MNWLLPISPTLTASNGTCRHDFILDSSTLYEHRFLLDNFAKENDVEPVVVCGIKVTPELGTWQGAVPEFVDELPHSLLLSLQPQVIAIASLNKMRLW